eukprot:IDg17491t1
MAAAVILTYDCYFRPEDLKHIHCNDFQLFDQLQNNYYGLIGIRIAKRSKHDYVFIQCPIGTHLVRNVITVATALSSNPNPPIFDFTLPKYRKGMRSIIASLQLPPSFTPHCLRAGGASTDALEGIPRGEIKIRGRWKDDKSMKFYIRPQLLRLIMNLLIPARRNWCESIYEKRH